MSVPNKAGIGYSDNTEWLTANAFVELGRNGLSGGDGETSAADDLNESGPKVTPPGLNEEPPPDPRRVKCAAPSEPMKVARQFAELLTIGRGPILFWRNRWFFWRGPNWEPISDRHVRNSLYLHLEHAFHMKPATRAQREAGECDKDGFVEMPWAPDDRKITKVMDALKSVVALGEQADAPCWLDGRKVTGNDIFIPCANGILHVSGHKQRRLIRPTPEFFNTWSLPFDYEPRAVPDPRWLQWLEEIHPDDVAAQMALQEWGGYCLTSRTELQQMLVLEGLPRSGKGTYARVLQAVLGTNNVIGSSQADLEDRFGLEPLLDAALVTFPDFSITGRAKKFVEIVKKISGEDPMTINLKGVRAVAKGRLTCRLMFMMNSIESFPDNSGAIVSRMVPIEFKHSFEDKQDPNIERDLKRNMPGLLNWFLDGLDRLIARGGVDTETGEWKLGKIIPPDSGMELRADLLDSTNQLRPFVEEMCLTGDADYAISCQELFDEWDLWRARGRYAEMNKNTFGQKVRALGLGIERKKRGPKGQQTWHYIGIRLREGAGLDKVRKAQEHLRVVNDCDGA